MSTLREQMIDAMLSKLALIRTANGYLTEVGTTVFVWFPSESQVLTLPSVNLRDTSAELDCKMAGRGKLAHKVSFEVLAMMETTASTGKTDLCNLHSDLTKWLYNGGDKTFGGFSIETEHDGSESRIFQQEDVVAAVKLKFTTLFVTSEGDESAK